MGTAVSVHQAEVAVLMQKRTERIKSCESAPSPPPASRKPAGAEGVSPRVRPPGAPKSQFTHFLAVIWGNHLTFLGLSFLICKIGPIRFTLFPHVLSKPPSINLIMYRAWATSAQERELGPLIPPTMKKGAVNLGAPS